MPRRECYDVRFTDVIIAQARQLERLIFGLLEIPQLDGGELELRWENVDFVAKAHDCADEAQASAESGPKATGRAAGARSTLPCR